MAENRCPECDRLWQTWGALTQMQFRLEETLRKAEAQHEEELAKELAAKLAYLEQDQGRISRALASHQVQHQTSGDVSAA